MGTHQAATKRAISTKAGGTTTGTTAIKHQHDFSIGTESSDVFAQWLEHRIQQMHNERNYPVGKRLRDNKQLILTRLQNVKELWEQTTLEAC